MISALGGKWWMLLLNGLCSIAFGVLALAWPGVTILSLVFLYGVYCLADGVTAIGASLGTRSARDSSWWQMLAIGVLSIAAAFLSFTMPGITARALVLLIAAWSIIHGTFEIIAAIELRKLIENELLLILAGALSIAVGALLIAYPTVGALGLIWMIGTFAICRGLLVLGLAWKMRDLKQVASHSSLAGVYRRA